MEHGFREYVDGLGVVELTQVKRAGRRTAIFLKIHGDERRLDLAADSAKRLDLVTFRCKHISTNTLEIHFMDNSGGFNPIDKHHPIMRQFIEAIRAKTTRRQVGLVQTSQYMRRLELG